VPSVAASVAPIQTSEVEPYTMCTSSSAVSAVSCAAVCGVASVAPIAAQLVWAALHVRVGLVTATYAVGGGTAGGEHGGSGGGKGGGEGSGGGKGGGDGGDGGGGSDGGGGGGGGKGGGDGVVPSQQFAPCAAEHEQNAGLAVQSPLQSQMLAEGWPGQRTLTPPLSLLLS
jgi:hypothetical protein